jgi:hypothetical protein
MVRNDGLYIDPADGELMPDLSPENYYAKASDRHPEYEEPLLADLLDDEEDPQELNFSI